jgi:transcription initiation factor IIE alpha subunit
MGERHWGKESQFFTCAECFEEYKVVYPYDSAKEAEFRCKCGGRLERFSRYEAMLLFNR